MVEREVESLSASELAAFRKWFHEFDAAAWDRQIEEDVQAGKLDSAIRLQPAHHLAPRYVEPDGRKPL
jgi:hypothetical protein